MENDEIHNLLHDAFPNLSGEELSQVCLDLETLCRVVLEQRELLRPLLALKEALDQNHAFRNTNLYGPN